MEQDLRLRSLEDSYWYIPPYTWEGFDDDVKNLLEVEGHFESIRTQIEQLSFVMN
jgi:hypothetical protein